MKGSSSELEKLYRSSVKSSYWSKDDRSAHLAGLMAMLPVHLPLLYYTLLFGIKNALKTNLANFTIVYVGIIVGTITICVPLFSWEEYRDKKEGGILSKLGSYCWPLYPLIRWAQKKNRNEPFNITNPEHVISIINYLEKTVEGPHDALRAKILQSIANTKTAIEQFEVLSKKMTPIEGSRLSDVQMGRLQTIDDDLAYLKLQLAAFQEQEQRSLEQATNVVKFCEEIRAQNQDAEELEAMKKAHNLVTHNEREIAANEAMLTKLSMMSIEAIGAMGSISGEYQATQLALEEIRKLNA